MTEVKTRLVVFGCSHTIGESLPDWDKEHDYSIYPIFVPNSNFKYSSLNWPNLLAEKLDRTVVNIARGGNSNHEIMIDILNFDFKPTDLVAVCWSHADREIIFDSEDPEGKFKTITILISQDDKKYKFYQAHDIKDLEIRSREYIQHTELYLKSKNINYVMGRVEHWDHNIQWKDNSYDDFVFFNFCDHASDGFHPGVESHRIFADNLYKKLNND